ncbi:hypothetical protein AUC61_01330 [Pseudomonas sp. S25]|uniref:Uncharacterized protein n=1 Tax=Pseudomonas maioricensis TaxID=1766623 RepID=A0ABS9ZCD4_9PSED|nr:hypothetical protein [Pseudomonas sp. S25]MCI8208164.1 hypothetical protein [Pseudomonas sp. S25]
MNEAQSKGIVFAMYYGDRNIGMDEISNPTVSGTIRIAPIVEGSKSSGGLQTVVGIALVVAAGDFSGGLAAGAGDLRLIKHHG